ncbi:MAG: OmpA family protein [Eubacteriales bacterium]|nr:OmpA family protein [Eubacteriales bacterium]
MKRRSKVSLGAATGASDSEQNFWPSYADMMSSFALILFFLMLLVYLSNLETGNNLKKTESQLSETLSLLSITQEEADAANASLLKTQDQLAEAEDAFATVQIKLDEANANLAGQQLVLSTQQAKIAEQEQYLAQANVEIERMYGQMETIVGIRRSILEQIKQSIEAVMGDSSRVMIGENGNIILNEGVFFDSGKSDLKAESVTVLNRLTEVFSTFLSNPENAKYIESIVISGHTDWDGTEENNLVLSTSRANAVLEFMLKNPTLNQYSSYFCAAGYGETRPVADNSTDEGKAQNRRIEISIILRDDTVMEIVNDYLNIEVPEISQ